MENYFIGLAELYYNGQPFAEIEKDSFNMNPVQPERFKLYCEQKPTGPVTVVPTSNGSFAPSFNVINMNFETLQKCFGGELVKEGEGEQAITVGWKAPSDDLVMIRGAWTIKFRTGQEIHISSALLSAALGGQVNLTSASRIECNLDPMLDSNGDSYGVYDTGKAPMDPAG